MFKAFLALASLLSAVGFVIAVPVAAPEPQGLLAGLPLLGGAAAGSGSGSSGSTGSSGNSGGGGGAGLLAGLGL